MSWHLYHVIVHCLLVRFISLGAWNIDFRIINISIIEKNVGSLGRNVLLALLMRRQTVSWGISGSGHQSPHHHHHHHLQCLCNSMKSHPSTQQQPVPLGSMWKSVSLQRYAGTKDYCGSTTKGTQQNNSARTAYISALGLNWTNLTKWINSLHCKTLLPKTSWHLFFWSSKALP